MAARTFVAAAALLVLVCLGSAPGAHARELQQYSSSITDFLRSTAASTLRNSNGAAKAKAPSVTINPEDLKVKFILNPRLNLAGALNLAAAFKPTAALDLSPALSLSGTGTLSGTATPSVEGGLTTDVTLPSTSVEISNGTTTTTVSGVGTSTKATASVTSSSGPSTPAPKKAP
ncbi:hypothetical protein MNEG_1174 [Monoraphidium neglectum]|uniref:FAS1 domain-containing protein n=1 Tax=Monoraphidium neglectum TaxID=145388 RepID=A0A0D2LK79_9CHLO|nr:hypothetical protein MNEG_1174 [Monoraphidium neglectum]KIZ06784.1 hypothetical protein MNEG_1174 [Monoraphidium neglectum]|eukprot:XP_013905803.1 hypothetical protein MNEG_1174 [Monoraphidium neglectum]